MPFVVFVASDLFGHKVNLELEFPFTPTLAELTQQTERAFEAEMMAKRPQGGFPQFQVAKFHVVDEVTDDWVEVLAAQQLRNYCQVYVFQPHSTRYTETQGHIPPASKPRYALGGQQLPAPPASVPRYGEPGGGVGGGGQWSAPPVAAPPPSKFPDAASHDDKVRATFEEIDQNKDRVIALDELRQAFQLACLRFSAATEEDLFRKADSDQDGVVSFAEWQRFAELYPTLLDCLYFRYQAHCDSKAKECAIDQHKSHRPQLEERERVAKAAFDKAVQDADEAARRVTDADGGVAEAQRRQRASEDAARAASGDVDRARQSLADRQRDLAAEQERERQAHMRAADSQREMDAAKRREAAAQHGYSEAEAAEARAQQALQDAVREKERQRALAEQAAADAARARERHDQIIGQIPQTVDSAARAVHAADQDAAAADRRARELAVAAAEAARAAEDAARARDDANRALQSLRDRQEPTRQALADQQRAIEDHDRQIAEMEAQAEQERHGQEGMWEDLRPVVEQEVRLREQRESLEEKEGALRNAHASFFATHKAHASSPPRPPYQSQYGRH
eukprot:TRINITY_DN17114_c0_g2_i1.p1 TRINITY_DN17114_c0_g2~~TRINITY_DN17114_c0_g2_i1.p1  ORF type:complete len:596 (+),score=246.84 TRINITY_DN17114_c0_g2_i1:87-1790(+)